MKRNDIIRGFCAVFVGILVGCNTTESMKLPKIKSADLIEIDSTNPNQAVFGLSKVVANIKRGTAIANFPGGGVEGVDAHLCNHKHTGESNLEWSTGSSIIGNWSTELGEVFHETLSQKGLKIAGDPRDLFGVRKSLQAVEYQIGARITDIKGNLCQEHHWWDGRPLNKFAGEFFVDVEWVVFSNLLQKTVLKVGTQGYHKHKKATANGGTVAFREAFAHAAENLLGSQEFIDIALRKRATGTETVDGSAIVFQGKFPRRTALKKDLSQILPAVVTIQLGNGHGSGFIISDDGLIVTNAHVVGDAQTVSVKLSNGLEIAGEVLRKHDLRDVALIKVPLRVPHALPIRVDGAQPLDEVFVIGTPIDRGLSSTVTSGIISAIRTDERMSQPMIQADAAISPGNSGGPLLDKYGNVIGVSVATMADPKSQSLNLFIPIGSALEALKVKQLPPKGVS